MARRPNAYSQLIQEGSHSAAPEETPERPNLDQDTAILQNRNTVKRQTRNTVKITIYPSQEQLTKLYDFMEAYRKKTGIRINQQDLIRRIIDVADINTVLP
jgi:hypothetical protein